jgi:hypothetical protein
MKLYWTKERVAVAEAREAAGETVDAIARSNGRTYSSLYRALHARGSKKWKERAGFWKRSLSLPKNAGVLGYIAGVMDSDGSLHISHSAMGVYWRAKVSMINEEIPRWLHSMGGSFHIEPRLTAGRNTVYTWRVSRAADLLHLIDSIQPYTRNVDRLAAMTKIRQWLAAKRH